MEIFVLLDREEQPQSTLRVWPWSPGVVRPLRRLEASAISWKIHVHKPSTHVLMPPKLGALREVACDNILHEMKNKHFELEFKDRYWSSLSSYIYQPQIYL